MPQPANPTTYPVSGGTFTKSQCLVAAVFSGVAQSSWVTITLTVPDPATFLTTNVTSGKMCYLWLLFQAFNYNPASASAGAAGPAYSGAVGPGSPYCPVGGQCVGIPTGNMISFTWPNNTQVWYTLQWECDLYSSFTLSNTGGINLPVPGTAIALSNSTNVQQTQTVGGATFISTTQLSVGLTPAPNQATILYSGTTSGTQTPAIGTQIAQPAAPALFATGYSWKSS